MSSSQEPGGSNPRGSGKKASSGADHSDDAAADVAAASLMLGSLDPDMWEASLSYLIPKEISHASKRLCKDISTGDKARSSEQAAKLALQDTYSLKAIMGLGKNREERLRREEEEELDEVTEPPVAEMEKLQLNEDETSNAKNDSGDVVEESSSDAKNDSGDVGCEITLFRNESYLHLYDLILCLHHRVSDACQNPPQDSHSSIEDRAELYTKEDYVRSFMAWLVLGQGMARPKLGEYLFEIARNAAMVLLDKIGLCSDYDDDLSMSLVLRANVRRYNPIRLTHCANQLRSLGLHDETCVLLNVLSYGHPMSISSKEEADFPIGCTVMLHSLSKEELNGVFGIVEKPYTFSNSRFGIRLDSSGKLVSIKHQNLRHKDEVSDEDRSLLIDQHILAALNNEEGIQLHELQNDAIFNTKTIKDVAVLRIAVSFLQRKVSQEDLQEHEGDAQQKRLYLTPGAYYPDDLSRLERACFALSNALTRLAIDTVGGHLDVGQSGVHPVDLSIDELMSAPEAIRSGVAGDIFLVEAMQVNEFHVQCCFDFNDLALSHLSLARVNLTGAQLMIEYSFPFLLYLYRDENMSDASDEQQLDERPPNQEEMVSWLFRHSITGLRITLESFLNRLEQAGATLTIEGILSWTHRSPIVLLIRLAIQLAEAYHLASTTGYSSFFRSEDEAESYSSLYALAYCLLVRYYGPGHPLTEALKSCVERIEGEGGVESQEQMEVVADAWFDSFDRNLYLRSGDDNDSDSYNYNDYSSEDE